MDVMTRIERALQRRSGARRRRRAARRGSAAAMRHAVFPRGARIRPRLCLAVAAACGEDAPGVTDAAAAAIELLHCASLVHDDLPCFDDADTRRGRPRVHRAFGEPLAVLAGDALIVLAFQTLAQGARRGAGAAGAADADDRRSRSACRAASSPGRPGNARTASISRNTSARRPARCSPPRRWPAPRRPGAEAEPWRPLGRCGSARPSRSPTTSCDATGDAGRARQAGRPGRGAWPARARCRELGLDGAIARLRRPGGGGGRRGAAPAPASARCAAIS